MTVRGLWRLPPVYSPVHPAAALRGLLARREHSLSRLEALLQQRYAAERVVLTGSGTHALQLALGVAAEFTGRREVALPAYTCYDIVTAAFGANVVPLFYDIDPDRLQPDTDSLDACLQRRPAAVVIVHQFGVPVAVDDIRRRATAADVLLIEDAAQGHGGFIGPRPLGSFAPLSVLSFGRGKGWTGGGGGALLMRPGNGDAVRTGASPPTGNARSGPGAIARLLAQWLLGRPSLYGLTASMPWLGLGKTHFVSPTAPSTMPGASAAVVLATDALAAREGHTRRNNARRLKEKLHGVEGLWTPPEPRPDAAAGYLRLPLRFPGRAATEVIRRNAHRLGVLPSYPRTLPSLPQVQEWGTDFLPTPGADTLAREVFTAPVHRFVDEDALDAIADALARAR